MHGTLPKKKDLIYGNLHVVLKLNVCSFAVPNKPLFHRDPGLNRIIFYRWLEVIFCSDKKRRVFDEAHTGHVGVRATLDNINRAFYWRHVVSEVNELVC